KEGRRPVVILKCPVNLEYQLIALSAVVLWLWSGSALAQLTTCTAGTVCYYVALQPIDVCATGGTGCAPFNTVNSTGSPTTVSSTNPIGFVDATGKDITRAMWNQIGVDISWAPMKQYNNTSYNSITVGSAAP